MTNLSYPVQGEEQGGAPPGQSTVWLWLAFAFCLLFGCALIVNIHPVGDGLWYWYATLFRGGHKLYSGLHLNLQPLFILLTAGGQALFGSGWVASKVLALVQTLLYLGLLFWVCKRVPWRNWERAALFLATFGLMLTMSYFRLDDYHITTHIFVLAGVALLLLLLQPDQVSRVSWLPWAVACGLGIDGGLSLSNRINDGAGLVVASGLVLFFTARRHRLLLVAVLCVMAAATLAGVVAATGDSLQVWAQESILHAAKIKGGTGSILTYPLRLPWMIAGRGQRDGYGYASLLSATFIIYLLLPTWTLYKGHDVRRRTGTWWVVLFLLVVTLPALREILHIGLFGRSISTVAIIPTYGVSLWILWRMGNVLAGRAPADWRPQEGLLLLPFFQLMAATMTAGTDMPEAAPAIGLTMLLVPISLPGGLRPGTHHRVYVTLVCFLAFVSFPTKIAYPYAWHHFVSTDMFHNRVVYHHPTLGPMVIGRPELALIKPMCDMVQQGGSDGELLSLPYPYPNYFCGIAPWHGYVQTWYDTSSEQTIQRLMQELATAPPKWIVYERALDSMESHETIFRGGKPLPHRALDAMIVNKVASGQWRVVFHKDLDWGHWFLLQTRA